MSNYQVGLIDDTFSSVLAYFDEGNYDITIEDARAVEELIKNDRSISPREHVKAYAKAKNLPLLPTAPKPR